MLELALHILDIVENSVRAGAALIEILVREDRLKDLFLMRITDNGSGMSPEERERALDPFYTTKKGGTGLGMSITKKIIEAHNGDIVIQSRQGKGTEVRIELPLQTGLKE